VGVPFVDESFGSLMIRLLVKDVTFVGVGVTNRSFIVNDILGWMAKDIRTVLTVFRLSSLCHVINKTY
jgi:hypothetical protein